MRSAPLGFGTTLYPVLSKKQALDHCNMAGGLPTSHFWGVAEDCCVHALNPTLQCLLVSIVFGTVSSLHPTSFIMTFTLVTSERSICMKIDESKN